MFSFASVCLLQFAFEVKPKTEKQKLEGLRTHSRSQPWRKGWWLATIRGVDLRIHPSLLILFFYVVVVSAFQFPVVLMEAGFSRTQVGGLPWIWGMAFGLALFVSVVLHEFGHVIMAQRLGIPVQSVTLMMLGGVSQMGHIPEKKWVEFKVSIVGPLVSFAIAAVLEVGRRGAGSESLSFFFYWISRLNLALGIFNLLPAFPLDGGRVLRSLLASRMDWVSATDKATRLGRVMAWGLGLLGLIGGNLILMLIAVFIYSASSQEQAVIVQRELLHGVMVAELTEVTPPLYPEQSLTDAAAQMMRSKIRILPVQLGGYYSATFRDGAVLSVDFLKRIPRKLWAEYTVRDLMEAVPRVISSQESLENVLEELNAAGALPVEESGQIVGILLARDLGDLIELRQLERKAAA